MDVFSFYKRIISRRDVYALKEVRGYSKQDFKLTKRILDSSLEYTGFVIGTYNINPDNNTTRNPLIDIDNHSGDVDVKKDTSLIYDWLCNHNTYPYIEGSGGDIKYGTHIGLICSKETRAIDVRDFLIQCLNELNLQHHEIYPKQDFVNSDSYGSLTKLPFQYNNRTKQRSMIINPKNYEPFNREDALEFLDKLPDSIIPISNRELEVVNIDNPTILSNNLEINIILTMCRPCIRDIYYNKTQLNDHEGHDFRVIIAIELINLGASDEVITDYFRPQTDFIESVSMSEIKKIRKKNYKTTWCSTIEKRCPSILDYQCFTCEGKY